MYSGREDGEGRVQRLDESRQDLEADWKQEG